MAIKKPQTKNEAFAQLDAMLSEEEKRVIARDWHLPSFSRDQIAVQPVK
jgi:hypothetical protein